MKVLVLLGRGRAAFEEKEVEGCSERQKKECVMRVREVRVSSTKGVR